MLSTALHSKRHRLLLFFCFSVLNHNTAAPGLRLNSIQCMAGLFVTYIEVELPKRKQTGCLCLPTALAFLFLIQCYCCSRTYLGCYAGKDPGCVRFNLHVLASLRSTEKFQHNKRRVVFPLVTMSLQIKTKIAQIEVNDYSININVWQDKH